MSFFMNDPCYIDHVHGLLPGKIMGKKVDGSAYQVSVDVFSIPEEIRLELAGRQWYDAAHVISVQEHDARVAAADEMMDRS